MSDDLSSLIEEFPKAPLGEIDPSTIQGNLDTTLERILVLAGYNESDIQYGVEVDIKEDAYEPPDLEIESPLRIPIYISSSEDSSPYIVGSGDRSMVKSPFHGNSDYFLYQSMIVFHETSGAEITLFLTPFDLLVYDGGGSAFHAEASGPIEYYPLHDQEFSVQSGREMIGDLQPPDELVQS